MFRQIVRLMMLILLAILVLTIVSPAQSQPETVSAEAAAAIDELRALLPASTEMIDAAIEALSPGWASLSPDEQRLFLKLFDPGNRGGIDDHFLDQVQANYEKIQRRLDGDFTLRYEADSDRCVNMRLYYTDLAAVHICPYFTQEDSDIRKARDFNHEVAHLALLVVDRPYYSPKTYSSRYLALTPRGPWTAQLPLIGPLCREISHSDTLYHPDAYAWFAAGLVQGAD